MPASPQGRAGRAPPRGVALGASAGRTESLLAGASRPLAAAWQDATTLPRPSGRAGSWRNGGAGSALLPRVRRPTDQEPYGGDFPLRYSPGGGKCSSPSLSRAPSPLLVFFPAGAGSDTPCLSL